MEKYFCKTLFNMASDFITGVYARGGVKMEDTEIFFNTETIARMNEEENAHSYNIGGTRYHFYYEYNSFKLNGYLIDIMTCFPENDDGLIVCPREMMCPVLYHEDMPYEVFMTRTPFAFTIRIQEDTTGYTLAAMSIAYDDFAKAFSNVVEALDKIASIS